MAGDPITGGREPWHLDKRIPVALIGVLVVQTLAIGIWVGTISARVDSAETWITENRKLDARLSVLESHMSDIKRILERMADRQERGRP